MIRRPRIRFSQKVLAALLIVGVAPIALVSAVGIQGTRNDLTSLGVTNIRQRSTSTATSYISTALRLPIPSPGGFIALSVSSP